jgi:hypothetical protein
VWFLVVLFLVNGVWLPGDIVAPDGWSKLEFNTEQECNASMKRFNENMSKTDYAGLVKSICTQQTDKYYYES